jgi:pimeloyl-ACP methyl ester carboxylesterase
MAPAIKSVELPNGVRLPYAEQGDPSGVPLLLVHGYAGSWRDFELLLPHLPPSIRALAPTQRGHGDASRPADGYRPRDLAADLVAFLDALRLEAAVLAGGSSGGIVARRFALDHPARTLGLVFLGSPATLRGNPGVQEMWDSDVSRLADPLLPDFVRRFIESTVDRPVPPAFLETVVQQGLKIPARVWKATLKGLLEDDSFAELGRVRAPTLVLWGDGDPFLPRSDQQALAGAIPGARLLVYPGAGHAFYWEEPARAAADLAAFVRGLADRAPGSRDPTG